MERNYYAVLPANVRYDKKLTPNAKLLYCEITALSNERGYCWGSNTYFAEFFGASESTVLRWINALIKAGYLWREIRYAEDGKTVLERRLTIVPVSVQDALKNGQTPPIKNDYPSLQKCGEGGVKNEATPPSKNEGENNININNILSPFKPPLPSKRQVLTTLVESSSLPGVCKAALKTWLEYKKYGYTELGLKTLIRITETKTHDYSAEAVVSVIEDSIANTWKGIIWERIERSAKPHSKQRNYEEV